MQMHISCVSRRWKTTGGWIKMWWCEQIFKKIQNVCWHILWWFLDDMNIKLDWNIYIKLCNRLKLLSWCYINISKYLYNISPTITQYTNFLHCVDFLILPTLILLVITNVLCSIFFQQLLKFQWFVSLRKKIHDGRRWTIHTLLIKFSNVPNCKIILLN